MRKKLVNLPAVFIAVSLACGALHAQGKDDGVAEISERDALSRKIERLKEELQKQQQRVKMRGHVVELWNIAVEMVEKGDREADRELLGGPQSIGPHTPLFLRVVRLCSMEGVLPDLFKMLENQSVSSPMKETLVYGILENPDTEAATTGYEALLRSRDSYEKYPERVRATAVKCLMVLYRTRGVQPPDDVVEDLLIEPSPNAVTFLLTELGKFGADWYPFLAYRICSQNRPERYGAMEGLQNLYIRGQITSESLSGCLQRMIKRENDPTLLDLAILMYGTHLKGEKHEEFLRVLLRNAENTVTAKRAAYVLMAFAENRESVFTTLQKLMYDEDNPLTREAAIWAVSVWPDDRKKALDALDKLRKDAVEYDRKNGLDVYYDETYEGPEGGHHKPLLQIVDDTLAWKLRYVPDVETVKFLRRLVDETPFQVVKSLLPYRMVECMQDEETEKLLKELTWHDPSAWVCYAAVKSYSILKGMEADEFLKEVVVESKLALRQEQAIKALGDRGYWYGPRCKALETLKALQKHREYEESVRKALANAIELAESYKPENWQKALDDIDKEEGYWLAVRSTNLGPDSYALKAGMQSEYIRRYNKAMIGLYGKFFELDEKETQKDGEGGGK